MPLRGSNDPTRVTAAATAATAATAIPGIQSMTLTIRTHPGAAALTIAYVVGPALALYSLAPAVVASGTVPPRNQSEIGARPTSRLTGTGALTAGIAAAERTRDDAPGRGRHEPAERKDAQNPGERAPTEDGGRRTVNRILHRLRETCQLAKDVGKQYGPPIETRFRNVEPTIVVP